MSFSLHVASAEPKAQNRDDRPRHDDRLGDPDWPEVEQRLEGQRRVHASLR